MQECVPGLPPIVAAAVTEALTLVAGDRPARVEADSTGALNHILFLNTSSGRFVFRMRRESSTVAISDYLGAMYRCAGFLGHGGVFRLRDMPAETAFLRQAHRAGLPVPQLLHDGGDWILIEYIRGRTSHSAVAAGSLEVVPTVLEAIHDAHEKGIIYGDRWGDNELIEDGGRVRFIDFDVEWCLPAARPGMLEALDVAVYLFNTLRLTGDRPGLLTLTRQHLAPWLGGAGYDMGRLSDFVEGLASFYLDAEKPANAWSLPASHYAGLNAPAAALVRILRDH